MKTAFLNLFRHVFILAVGLLLFPNFVRLFFVFVVQWESAEMKFKADACKNKLLIGKTFSFCTKIHFESLSKPKPFSRNFSFYGSPGAHSEDSGCIMENWIYDVAIINQRNSLKICIWKILLWKKAIKSSKKIKNSRVDLFYFLSSRAESFYDLRP